MNEEIRTIFNELEEDLRRLSSLIGMIKGDLIKQDTNRAKMGLETASSLAERIYSNSYRLLIMIEKAESSR